MSLEVYSFSYRYGSGPKRQEGDLIVDCRVLANPYRGGDATGLDKSIQDRVLSNPRAMELVNTAVQYGRDNPDGRILVGCSFGRHRSVAVAEVIARQLGVKAHHTSRRMRGA